MQAGGEAGLRPRSLLGSMGGVLWGSTGNAKLDNTNQKEWGFDKHHGVSTKWHTKVRFCEVKTVDNKGI